MPPQANTLIQPIPNRAPSNVTPSNVGGGGGAAAGGAFGTRPFDVQTSIDAIDPGAFTGELAGRNRSSFRTIEEIFPGLQEANPFLPLSFGQGNFTGQFSDPVNRIAGPVFDEGVFGRSGALGAALNLRFSQLLEGGLRGQEREGLLRELIPQGRSSQANLGGESLAARAGELIAPGALDERFARLARQATEQSASGLANTRGRLQDLGIASAGSGQTPAVIGAEAGAQRSLSDQLINLESLQAQEGRANLGAAGGALATSAGLFDQFQTNPVLRLIGALQGPQNLGLEPFANQLERAEQLERGTALSSQGINNLPGILSLVGGAAGGVLGGIGGGGPAGAAAGFGIGSAGGNVLGGLFQ